MPSYETTFILDSLMKNEEIEEAINKYERFISVNGGQIVKTERWGKKRLAYEIKKRQYGFYVHIRFDGPPSVVKPIEREYRLNESILRYLTVAVDKRMLAQEQLAETRREVLPSSAEVEPTELTTEPEEQLLETENKGEEFTTEKLGEPP